LVVRVEPGRIGKQRVAPTHDRVPGAAFGDDELVDVVVDRIDGGEVEASSGGGAASGRARCGAHRDGQGSGGRGSEDGTAAELGVDDIAEVPVRGGVARGLEAGVIAFQGAGDWAAFASYMVGHRQKASHRCSPRFGVGTASRARDLGRWAPEGSLDRASHRQLARFQPTDERRVNPARSVRIPVQTKSTRASTPGARNPTASMMKCAHTSGITRSLRRKYQPKMMPMATLPMNGPMPW